MFRTAQFPSLSPAFTFFLDQGNRDAYHGQKASGKANKKVEEPQLGDGSSIIVEAPILWDKLGGGHKPLQ